MADTEERQMLPEVQAFITARDEALRVHTATERELTAKYPDRWGYSDESRDQRAAFNLANNEAYEKFRVTQSGAWNALTKSSDPLVRWIAENCKDYQDYAIEILKALPATVEELDEVANDGAWCYVWNNFRDKAELAGVLPGVPAASPGRKALHAWAERYTSLGYNSRRELNRLLDEFKAEEIAA